ncbi:MAG: hypothetical protein Q9222_005684 [Ikaeria aurantiellina]
MEPCNTFGPQLYSIQDIPGKGHGLVAGVDIDQGQRILREAPLFTSSLRWVAYKDFEDHLAGTLSSLPATVQAQFFSLHNANPQNEYPLQARFLTSCLPCNDDQTEGAIFANASLINHSCRANCSVCFNAEDGIAAVYATRNITAGEELTINYVFGLTSAVRADKLKRLFDITCSCDLCSSPAAAIARSDAQRMKIQRFFDAVGNPDRVANQPKKCIAQCALLLKLIKKEYGGGSSEFLTMSAAAYDAATRVSMMHSDTASACVMQKKSYDLRVLFQGIDYPFVRQLKKAIEYEHQEGPIDMLRRGAKWYSKRGEEPRLLKFMTPSGSGNDVGA